jgi:toxin ParE1/3/4
MVRDLTIRPEAEVELADAYAWYEDKVSGLGADFLNAVEAALFSIKRNPEINPVVFKSIRRCLTRRFPYAIFYTEEPTRIVVLTVFHVRRNPATWKNRT